MASPRPYDLVVFGASGFTGQFVVDEVARVASEEGHSLTWAIAGRSMDKLQKILEQSSQRTGKALQEIPIIIADTNNDKSLGEMCSQTKVLLNCVGPYNIYGEPVVRACVESGASHLDISGEPRYLERSQLLYNQKAKEAGVYIVSSCGWDSIPADMGVAYIQEVFEGDVHSVEMFVEMHGGPDGLVFNTGTFDSAVIGFSHMKELKELRKSLYPTPLPRSPHKAKNRGKIFYSDELKKWCIPFLGSDKSVVYRSQRHRFDVLEQQPSQFMPYLCMPNFFSLILLTLAGFVFGLFSMFSFGRKLMTSYPSFFSGGLFQKSGPTKKQMEASSFTSTFIVEGYSKKVDSIHDVHQEPPDSKMITTVTGPEVGYVSTPICLVQAALCLLEEKGKLPKEGGVITPATAFRNTSLVQRLCKRGVIFEIKT